MNFACWCLLQIARLASHYDAQLWVYRRRIVLAEHEDRAAALFAEVAHRSPYWEGE